MWKKWETWYNAETGHQLMFIDESVYLVRLFARNGAILTDKYFNTEAEAREFIEEFIK